MTRDLRVCFVGDSFTAGTGDETATGWVGPVVAAVRAAGTPVTGYELGVRRETSIEIARRWYPETRARLRDGDDLRVVFSFGANDVSAPAGRPRVPHERSLAVLTDLLDEAAASGWPAFVVGPPASLDPAQTARAVDLSAGMTQVAEECGVPFVDLAAPLAMSALWAESVRAGDGIHPDSRGYRMITEIVRPPLVGWLTRP
ncbi:GDSL-type esterase/lipase family protein [Goekera deserti]|uniref:G-D-S-L family lipolytic protein n=1 Tax=Goekera deserti TaxID=2497753 RepID=A0A7K3WJX4_9ACTN|nr:GDSL-type esterase/lipase family protein [Goekera deserti]NDI50379.1 G-D-S-L family lipolytic protein [Goekera deserti]NEL56676.1 G-D-S-L family lipolytic protein [Goekera deserti]